MKNINQFLILITLFCLVLVSTTTYAGVETFNNRVEGTNISVGTTISVKDDKYNHMILNNPGWEDHYANYKIKNRVILGIDPTKPENTSSTLIDRCFELIIVYRDALGSPTTITKELSISYSDDLSQDFDNKVVYEFNGGQYLKVYINDITDCSSASPVAPLNNMYLETEVEVERYYKLYKPTTGVETINVGRTRIDIDGDASYDEIDIHWNYIEGAEEFDLEWMFVNDVKFDGTYAGFDGLSATDISYNFKNNGTRVTVKDNHYKIPLTFESGHVVYRVRGVGRGGSDFTKRINGPWSIAESGTLDLIGVGDYYPGEDETMLHEQNKNWQYTANFAEEGKRKEVISYMDGTLRDRQSVTKSNTENTTIVGQKVYDYQGRPAINILPTPTDTSIIKYYETFNEDDSTLVFTKNDFDIDDTPCVINIPILANTSGASKYYSSNNPNLLDENSYIPDANQYPYSQIEYTPDNTGRIRRQGGVGEAFQLESGHETKYFYGKPATQQELDRLFGSEAGDKSHYKKTMVKDANGQISVSYIDMMGKTVATFLAGNPNNTSDRYDGLTDKMGSSVYSANSVNADLLNKLNSTDTDTELDDNHLSLDGKSLVYTQELLIDNEQKYDFSYTLNDVDYTDACMLAASCFDCAYDLTIDLVDECGISRDPFPITRPLSAITDNTTCEDLSFSLGAPGTDMKTTSNLEVGQYTLTKTLSINEAALDHYKSIYIDNLDAQSGCFTDSTDMYDDQHDDLTADSPCDDITCQDCIDGIPSLENYRIDVLGPTPHTTGSPNFYTQLQLDQTDFERNQMIEECDVFCDTYLSLCEVRLKMMKHDVSPGGQYGAISNISNQVLSVYNKNNLLPKNVGTSLTTSLIDAHWGNPVDLSGNANDYLDASGNPYKVTIHKDPVTLVTTPNIGGATLNDFETNGYALNTGWVYPYDLVDVNDFLDIWEPQWADNLVFYHPEFCYYRSCDDLGEGTSCTSLIDGVYYNSDEFDELIYNAETYAEAIDALDLISTIDLDHTDLLDKDPYNVACNSIMTDDPTNFVALLSDFSSSTYNASEIASTTVQCGSNYTTTISPTCTTVVNSDPVALKNAYWEQLKNYYLATKTQAQAQRADRIAAEGSCFSRCIGDGDLVMSGMNYPQMFYEIDDPDYPVNPNNLPEPQLVWGGSHWTNVLPIFEPDYPGSSDYIISWTANDEQVDPCSYYWKNRYKNKVRIWSSADHYASNNGSLNAQTYIDENQQQGEYQNYLATGNCPLGSQLESLLNAIAVNGDLTATNKLFFDISGPTTNYPEFTQALFEDIGGVNTANNDFDFSGVTSMSNSVLTLTIGGTNQTATCSTIVLTFTTPNPDSYSFSNGTHPIVGFTDFQATTSGNFEIYAIIDHNNLGTTFVKHKLTGTTCIDIDGCEFDDVCEASTEAFDLTILMNQLLNTGSGPDIDETSVALDDGSTDDPVYNGIITNSLLGYIGGSWGGSTITWEKASSTNYILTDGTDEIEFTLDAAFSGTLNSIISIVPNPDYSGWSSGSDNTNVIISYDNGSIQTIKATVTADGGTNDTFIGKCFDPSLTQCQTEEHKIREDLEGLISELLNNGHLFNTSGVSIASYTSLTALLKDKIGLVGAADIIWKYTALSNKAEFIYEDSSAVQTAVCDFNIEQLYADPNYDQSDADELLVFSVDENNLINGYAQGFTLTLKDGVSEEEAIYVCSTTCLPLAGCYPCSAGETPTELVLNSDIESFSPTEPSGANLLEYASDVTNPTNALPDYLHTDGFYDNDETTCSDGINENEGMIGIVTYKMGSTDYREYAQLELANTLVAERTYNISYTIKKAKTYGQEIDYSVISTNGIGAYLTDNALDYASPAPGSTDKVLKASKLNHAPDNMALNGAVIDDDVNCTTINFKYVARGDESHIVIGCFLDDDEINKIPIPGQVNGLIGYYLIDDVSVKVEGCGFEPAIFPEYEYEDPCDQFMEDVADENADMLYSQQIDTLLQNFEQDYIEHCMSNAVETFNILYDDGDYHFTLYYYDQAGNLVRTVPPEGVNPITISTELDDAKAYRITQTGTFVPTTHTMETTYEYNSLNQLTKQNTPDAGVSLFWYDELGRLVLSQNAKQNAITTDDVYSYTVYDDLGRIVEVGEVTVTLGNSPSNGYGFVTSTELTTILTGSKKEVTKTYYDEPLSTTINNRFNTNSPNTNGQENLRNRVATITYEDIYDGNDDSYQNATHYSYDVHGNVKTLIQDVKRDELFNQRFKRVDYEYDLVSGNVNKVSYQAGFLDQYYHKYEYDADNRITNVYTSRDNVIWNQDAKYFYYPHGPLARVEIGNEKVQTTDFAYTLQGWLKGINSNTLNVNRDIGKDGKLINNNNNRYVARDAYSYSLGYYDNNNVAGDDYKDFEAIGGSTGTTSDFLAAIPTATGLNSFDRNLYNGNIKHMVTTITDLENSSLHPMPQATAYHYDQLNRITGMEAFGGNDYVSSSVYSEEHLNFNNNEWDGLSSDGRYGIDNINYDKNGNIYDLERDGKSGTLTMDVLEYKYISGTNKLEYVDDIVSTYTTDIDDQSSGNYRYDEIGNLVADIIEDIGDASNDGIEWTVYGKIKNILRQTNGNEDIGFRYDANGNRILKATKPRSSGSVSNEKEWSNFIYKRDASGNVMAIYKQTFTHISGDEYESTIVMQDIPIYGSSRIGVDNKDVTYTTRFNATFNGNGEFVPSLTPVGVSLTSASRIGSDSLLTIDGETDSEYNFYALEDVNIKSTANIIVLEGSYEAIGDNEINVFAGNQVNIKTNGDVDVSSTTDFEVSANRTISVLSPAPITFGPAIHLGIINNYKNGQKAYEFTNHLGNVLTVVSDKKGFESETPYNTEIESGFEGGDFHLFKTGDYTSLQVDDQTFATYNSSNYSIITTTNDVVKIVTPVQPGDIITAGVYANVDGVSGTSGNFTFGIIDLNTDYYVGGMFQTPVKVIYNTACACSTWNLISIAPYTVPSNLSSTNLAAVVELSQPAGSIDTYWDDLFINVDHSNNPDYYFTADVKSVSDYYPFGSLMPGRHYPGNLAGYRYGFNKGSEKDDEITGVEGAHITTFFREYDNRLGRTWSMDPVTQPHQSPYTSMDNNPILFNDPMGDKVDYKGKGTRKAVRQARRRSRRTDGQWNRAFKMLKKDEDMFVFRKIDKQDNNLPDGADNTFAPNLVINGKAGSFQIGNSPGGTQTGLIDEVNLPFRESPGETIVMNGSDLPIVGTKRSKVRSSKKYYSGGTVTVTGTSNTEVDNNGYDRVVVTAPGMKVPIVDAEIKSFNQGYPESVQGMFNFTTSHGKKLKVKVMNAKGKRKNPNAFGIVIKISGN